jgi:hypothetical protein
MVLSVTFPNVQTIINIPLTLLISDANHERSFNTLRRVKNYASSTILEELLISPAI